MNRFVGLCRRVAPGFLALLFLVAGVITPAFAQQEHRPGGEVNLLLPDLRQGDFLGFTGHQILLSGLVVCAFGLLFGLMSYAASSACRCTRPWRRSRN